MSERRFIIEMGTGNSQHGQDYTRAAGRAIEDAIRHAQLSILSALGIDDQDMRVQVTVGVQKPEAVDCDALAGMLPRGRAEVRAVFGGLDVTDPDTGAVTVVAQAAVEAFLPQRG